MARYYRQSTQQTFKNKSKDDYSTTYLVGLEAINPSTEKESWVSLSPLIQHIHFKDALKAKKFQTD